MYYIIYPIFYLVSLLPMSFLYLLSDGLYVILYYIVAYRKQVVRRNLMNAFPQYSLYDIIQIEKKYFRFLSALIVETIKLMSISPVQLQLRCVYTSRFQSIFQRYYAEQKSIIVCMGHTGNWEWAGAAFNLYFKNTLYVLYHPLSNSAFDKLIYNIRTRFGTHLIPMRSAYKHILSYIQDTQSNVFTFIADQSPSVENAFWMSFLNQDTAVFFNTEIIARKLKLPVVFVFTKCIKKGYYEVDAVEYMMEANTDKIHYPMMYSFMKELEKRIIEQPECWLWSHKRWKHQRKRVE